MRLFKKTSQFFFRNSSPYFSKLTNPTSGWKLKKIYRRVDANCINFHVEATSP
nr:prepilin-type N-terminal cleavage/methylation domain-containing protein [Candidatus Hamiltonella defensa]